MGCNIYVLLPYGTFTYRTVLYGTVRCNISTVAVYNEYKDYYMILRPTNLYLGGGRGGGLFLQTTKDAYNAYLGFLDQSAYLHLNHS